MEIMNRQFEQGKVGPTVFVKILSLSVSGGKRPPKNSCFLSLSLTLHFHFPAQTSVGPIDYLNLIKLLKLLTCIFLSNKRW